MGYLWELLGLLCLAWKDFWGDSLPSYIPISEKNHLFKGVEMRGDR